MKISVVVPTYRRPELLLRCLDNLCAQIFPRDDFEIVVVTDGPDAVTSQAISNYRTNHRVRYFFLTEKRGPAAVRNFGWRKATANFIAFTDDDCLPHHQWLENLWNARQASRKKNVAFSGNTIVPVSSPPTDYELNISHLATAEFITANCACTKTALEKVNGFDEAFTMAWREDSDLQFRFIACGVPIIKVPDALVTHPVRKAPWGVSIKEERKGIFNALLYKKFPSLYRERIQPSPPWLYYAIVFSLIMFFVGLFKGAEATRVIGGVTWLVLTGAFVVKRLASTRRTPRHIAEMIVTSAIIPVLSLYWRIYGAVRFKSPLFP